MINKKIKSNPSNVNAIRNPDGIWVNTQCFMEEANHFKKYGRYTFDPWGSPAWEEYWREQLRRCLEGYSTGSARITGHHYGYLNFGQITKVVGFDKRTRKAKKEKTFGDFWDGDYNYFHALDIADKGITRKALDDLQLSIKIENQYLDGARHIVVGKSRRKGYEQPYSEKIIIPSGETTMGEIKVGDYVSTPCGGRAKVIEKFEQGIKDIYEVTLQDGRKVRCGLEHLWEIQEFRGYKKIVNTKFFLDKKLKRGTKGKEYYSYYLPQTKEVRYNKQENKLPLDPYLLGLLIGDGSLTQGSCLFSTIDLELLDYVKDIIGNDYSINKKTETQYSITYKLKEKKNPILDILGELKLKTLAINKFIPEQYKYATIEERYEIVRGLMDSDGSIWKQGCCNFVNTSEKLIDDLQYILRGLGIRTTKSKNNNVGVGFSVNQSWTLIITTDKPIFKLKRKLEKLKIRRYDINKIAITKVEKLNIKEKCACILIDSKENLYLTSNFVVTHNSFKNGFVCANTYNTIRNSLSIIGAFDKKYLYPEGTMAMSNEYLNFFNEHTGFRKNRLIDKVEHKKSGFEQTIDGVKIEKGYKSQIMAITFKDNPDAARGKDAIIVLLEEAGAFPNLLEAINATGPSMEAGAAVTGQMLVFGTGGDMEKGTLAFAELFYNPDLYRFMPFVNIWDEDSENTECGFFHPVYWNMEGYYDTNGNSDVKGALAHEKAIRDKMHSKASSSSVVQQRVQEYCTCPAEAFLTVSMNDFPVLELRNQLTKVTTNKLHLKFGQAGTLYYEEGEVRFKPDLNNELEPIWFNRPTSANLKGCTIIYEAPKGIYKGLYKIGYDPYRQALGGSLGSIIVYKTMLRGDYSRNCIVAEYTGRPQDPDDMNMAFEMLTEFYHNQGMYENEVTHVKSYFLRRKKLHLLATQPDLVISKNTNDSKVDRVYGCHMNDQMKDAGEKYIKSWLLTQRDINSEGKILTNIDYIYSPGLLEQLIKYNRKGNYDRVMALMQVMFQVQEEELGKEHTNEEKKNEKIVSLINNLYKR